MIRSFIASTLIALTLPLTASADTWTQHRKLINSLRNVGVTVRINDPAVCNRKIDGRYWSAMRRLDVCQDNHTLPYVQVRWTANDLDTLRHEAHHVVQDCMDRPFDGSLKPMFGTGSEWDSFVGNAMSPGQAKNIMSQYPTDKAYTELEAFAVARTVDAATIADKLEEFCGA